MTYDQSASLRRLVKKIHKLRNQRLMTTETKKFADRLEALKDFQHYIDSNLDYSRPYEILEAGCGSMSKVTFPGEYRIIGVDISEKQLERNDHLAEKICADIQHYDLGKERFDVIICWDVLEHLQQPDLAMSLFEKAVKRGGLVILALPNLLSLKGLFTKFTPHWVHVLYYRWILKRADAGKHDTPPFKTYLRWSITPDNIQKRAFGNFLMEYFNTRDSMVSMLKESHWYLYRVYQVFSYALYIVSLGYFGGMKNSDFIIVLRKP
jgi:2-polyprenyl-3-methyl-5-hydroxy-6-metoxy-1,4-benzoquinol methylase